jgi:hypothetical protein
LKLEVGVSLFIDQDTKKYEIDPTSAFKSKAWDFLKYNAAEIEIRLAIGPRLRLPRVSA